MGTKSENANKLFYSLSVVLAASKKLSWRQSAISEARAVVKFLTDKCLTTVNLQERLDKDPDTFEIRDNDLSDEGLGFVNECFSKFEDSVGRWKNEPTEEKYINRLNELYSRYWK